MTRANLFWIVFLFNGFLLGYTLFSLFSPGFFMDLHKIELVIGWILMSACQWLLFLFDVRPKDVRPGDVRLRY